MRLLLDTHVVLWAIAEQTRLSATARGLLKDESMELIFSAASIWEIELKRRAGKLTLPEGAGFLAGHIRRVGVRQVLAISPEHAYRIATLPTTHKDPFDCLLAAQCLVEGLTLVSSDPVFPSLGVEPVW